MNEVTRIHLGRQSFTIAADAHQALKAYLADIKKEVGSKSVEVIKEVELRMVELLAERGVTGDKVVLLDDVAFLQEQLGDPKDFKEDDDQTDDSPEPNPSKRLFRDTENGMLAGVAAGLANYFGIDALIIRILFVIATFTGGWGLLLYLVLWIIVPEAKTSSERLQMQGKPVTVDSLKEIVERADVHGAAHRASNSLAPTINALFGALLKIAGFTLLIVALCIAFGLTAAGFYVSLHHGPLVEENLFPVGTAEHAAIYLGLAWAGLATTFAALIGIAMVRRRWPIAGWATGVILGLLMIGMAAGAALGADIAPSVHNRVEDAHHTITRSEPAFTDVAVSGDLTYDVNLSNTYSVTLRYIGQPDLSKVKISVVDGRLVIDGSQLPARTDCQGLCLFPRYDMVVTINTPVTPTSFTKPLTPEPPVAPIKAMMSNQ